MSRIFISRLKKTSLPTSQHILLIVVSDGVSLLGTLDVQTKILTETQSFEILRETESIILHNSNPSLACVLYFSHVSFHLNRVVFVKTWLVVFVKTWFGWLVSPITCKVSSQLLTDGRLQPVHPLYKIAGGDFVAAKNTWAGNLVDVID